MATQRLGLIMHGVTGRMGMIRPSRWVAMVVVLCQ